MSSSRDRASQVRDLAEAVMERAFTLKLGLTEDDSVYGLTYIGEKLTKVTAYMEQLGDMSMDLMKISLEVSRAVRDKKSLYRNQERQLRADPNYAEGDRSDKTGWLMGKLEVFKVELEDWELTHSYLNEIRGAVNERIQLFKRLDSDIRLQHKLVEAKIAAGAMGSVPGGKGNQGEYGFPSKSGPSINELEID